MTTTTSTCHLLFPFVVSILAASQMMLHICYLSSWEISSPSSEISQERYCLEGGLLKEYSQSEHYQVIVIALNGIGTIDASKSQRQSTWRGLRLLLPMRHLSRSLDQSVHQSTSHSSIHLYIKQCRDRSRQIDRSRD